MNGDEDGWRKARGRDVSRTGENVGQDEVSDDGNGEIEGETQRGP